MGSIHEDYLLRQVKAVATMLARILGLRMSGETEEARVELEQAFGLLLGPRCLLIRTVDPYTAATLLASPDAILALAQLTNEEAEQQRNADRAAALRWRAVELTIEALQRDEESREARDFLTRVASAVDEPRLAPERKAILEQWGVRRSRMHDG